MPNYDVTIRVPVTSELDEEEARQAIESSLRLDSILQMETLDMALIDLEPFEDDE